MQGIVENRLRDARPDGHHGPGDQHHHDLHGLMPAGAIGAWMGDETVALTLTLILSLLEHDTLTLILTLTLTLTITLTLIERSWTRRKTISR